MQQIFKEIACQNDVSPEEVQAEIKLAIQLGMACSDPAVQRRWAEIPKQRDVPTPEEVISCLIAWIQETNPATSYISPTKPFELAAK